jgi:hypothetical protein
VKGTQVYKSQTEGPNPEGKGPFAQRNGNGDSRCSGHERTCRIHNLVLWLQVFRHL